MERAFFTLPLGGLDSSPLSEMDKTNLTGFLLFEKSRVDFKNLYRLTGCVPIYGDLLSEYVHSSLRTVITCMIALNLLIIKVNQLYS